MGLFSAGGRAPWRALLLCVVAGAASGARAEVSIAIVPPYVEKVVRSGSTVSDTIAYTNQGDLPVVVSVDFADFGVTEDGEVTELPPATDPSTLTRHLHFSPVRMRVQPDQQVFFRYTVDTPDEFEQMRSMVFLSSYPDVPAGGNRVQIVARMGVPLYVENIRAAPAKLEVRSVEIDRAEDAADRVRLRLVVVNTGQRNIRPSGEIHLRSADGRFASTFELNKGREPVLPGQKRRWEQYFGPVPEGELQARLRLASSARSSYEAEASIPALAH